MKKNYSIELLPDKVNYEAVESKINTRKQLNDTITMMKVFTERGSEETVKSTRGLVIPKFKIKQTQIKVKQINRERRKERKKFESMPTTDRNKVIEQGKIDYKEHMLGGLQPKHFNYKNMSKKDFEMYQKTLGEYDKKETEKLELYRKNYYKAMKNQLTAKQFEKLKKTLDKIPSQVLTEKYYTDLNMSIDFYYELLDGEVKFKEMIKAWNSVKKEGGYE